jgi:hypothetical protein
MSFPRLSTEPITHQTSTPDAPSTETQQAMSTVPSAPPRFHVLWEFDIDADDCGSATQQSMSTIHSAPPRFHVLWAIDIAADDCRTAAQHAWKSIRRRHSIANVFHVTDRATGTQSTIDLSLLR